MEIAPVLIYELLLMERFQTEVRLVLLSIEQELIQLQLQIKETVGIMQELLM